MAVDLLQRVGLNKYEAEAYLALLTEGPLTGYELGKRSGVPLSKSYETLERLARRGLALIQPGDPPRYLAEQPERFVAQTRSDQEAVLTALTAVLAEQQRADPSDQFWVVRGRANVLNRARALLAEASDTIVLGWGSEAADLAEALDAARGRGCRATVQTWDHPTADLMALLVDDREVLVGTLTPADQCQAVASRNAALVAAMRLALSDRRPESVAQPTANRQPLAASQPEPAWLDWEARKAERLRRLAQGGRVA